MPVVRISKTVNVNTDVDIDIKQDIDIDEYFDYMNEFDKQEMLELIFRYMNEEEIKDFVKDYIEFDDNLKKSKHDGLMDSMLKEALIKIFNLRNNLSIHQMDEFINFANKM
jgi:hypothetical protein